MKIGPGVSELWGVENRPLPLTRPVAYTTACSTVQAVMLFLLTCNNVSNLSKRQVSSPKRTVIETYSCHRTVTETETSATETTVTLAGCPRSLHDLPSLSRLHE